MQGKKQGRNSCVQVSKLLRNLVSLPIQWMTPTQSTSSSFFQTSNLYKILNAFSSSFCSFVFSWSLEITTLYCHATVRNMLDVCRYEFLCWRQPFADFTKAGLVQNKLLSNYLFNSFNCFAYYVYQIVYFCNATLRLITVSLLANLIDLLF